MRFFRTRSASEATHAFESDDSYWRVHRPDLFPKRRFAVRKLTASALGLAGAMIGALFVFGGADEQTALSDTPRDSAHTARAKPVRPEQQSLEFAHPWTERLPHGGYGFAALDSAESLTTPSSGTPAAATVDTRTVDAPVAAPPIVASSPAAPRLPDVKTAREPDAPIETRQASGADGAGAARATDAAAPNPGPRVALQTGDIAGPKHASPPKLSKKASAHLVAATDAKAPSAAAETASRPVRPPAHPKPRKSAKAPKPPQVAGEPQEAPQAVAEPQEAQPAAAEPQDAPQAATEPQEPRRPAAR